MLKAGLGGSDGFELENVLFTYPWLSLHTPNPHAGRIAQLIEESERCGKGGMVEKARMKTETTRSQMPREACRRQLRWIAIIGSTCSPDTLES